MKPNLRLILSLILCVFMCFSLFAAGQEETEAKAEGPLELTFFDFWANYPYSPDMPVFQQAEKMTGIRLKCVVPKSASDGMASFNLMMASGEIADIVNAPTNSPGWKRENFFTYGMEGAFLALNGLIDKQAPHIKAFLQDNPDVTKYVTAPDGNIYHIAYIRDGAAAHGWFIRQDWLDKLGLKVPKTTPELYQALKAFKEKDANGNGKMDEVPYFSRGKETGIDALAILWDAYNDYHVVDGKVLFGPFEPQF